MSLERNAFQHIILGYLYIYQENMKMDFYPQVFSC